MLVYTQFAQKHNVLVDAGDYDVGNDDDDHHGHDNDNDDGAGNK